MFQQEKKRPCVVASVCTLRTQQGTFNHHYFSMLLNMVDSKPVTDLYILLCVTNTTLTARDGTRHSLLGLIRNNNNINKPNHGRNHFLPATTFFAQINIPASSKLGSLGRGNWQPLPLIVSTIMFQHATKHCLSLIYFTVYCLYSECINF